MARLCLNLSYPFRCEFFSSMWCVGVAQLVLGFLSEEIVLYVAVDLVCLWDEVSSAASYIADLNQKSQVFFRIQLSLKVACHSKRSLSRCLFSICPKCFCFSLSDYKIWGLPSDFGIALDIMASSYTLLLLSKLHYRVGNGERDKKQDEKPKLVYFLLCILCIWIPSTLGWDLLLDINNINHDWLKEDLSIFIMLPGGTKRRSK